ncbi:hypothetical protein DOTSEDRAFT_72233 [Dothistroma septosporum NZE10]|uniref:tyrosinase n=1 Tax=Dothistroma septosporum (strain NZE10 / CBS 128990) TaxID=675120 RepID=N1PQK2_DOTSN|nr:hypothetical protein DOTSEDRAFT_72233 [Dothistroma septosporum NZE10]
MRFLAAVSAISVAFTSVSAHIAAPAQDAPTLEERQNGILVTSGAGGSTVYPRYEIRQMKDNYPNQYTLLVLAMEQWKARSQSDQTGYFQISGIHGVPRVNYNNVGQCSSCAGSDGYCTHDSILFPSWHRVYVAHFEQEFLKVVKTIAASYPAGNARTTMQNAANVMRWPYWDWAAKPPSGRPTLPKIVSDYSVTVNAPSGSRTFNNPLFRYDFTDNSGLVYTPFTTWQRTYRYPSSNSANAASDTQSCINAFDNVQRSLQDQVYSLFTQCKDYAHFSNDNADSSSTQCSNSLEGIHNTVHGVAGGPGSSSVSAGHMTYLPTAAFDPVFWLHHCNVDRIFAMWQRINPNSYGGSQTAPHNTWTIAQGSTQNAGSNLTPFYKNTNGQFWTTNDVKDWAGTFKYTYPEFADSDGSAAAINNYINGLYSPNAAKTAGSSKREAMPQVSDLSSIASSLNTSVLHGITNPLADALASNPLAANNGSLYQYVANINTPRYKLGGSYSIYCFTGKPGSEDPTTWATAKNLAGTMGVLSQPGMSDSNVIVAGSIPLTTSLQSLFSGGVLAGLTEAIIAPFLAANLNWRVLGPAGNSVDPGTIDGFVFSVVTSTAQQPSDASSLPVFSPFINLIDVTKDQSGGANSTEQATAAQSGAGAVASAALSGASYVESTVSSTLGSIM